MSSNFFFIFGHSEFFWPILAKKVAELSKLNSQFQWKLSGESFLQNLQIVFVWISSGKLSAGCPKKVRRAFMLLSTSPWELSEENNFEKFLQLLWTFFQIISRNWAGKVRSVCQNCIHRTINSFWKKTLLKNKWIFSSFLDIEQEVFGFMSSFSTGMLELHSRCPG